jgi:hypothetical protein
MEDQHKDFLKLYNFLSIAFAAIILSNVWLSYGLNKSYESSIAKVIEKTTIIEKEIAEIIHPSVAPTTKFIDDVEDLREYITLRFPKILEKDVEVIASEIDKHCFKHNIPFSLIVGLIDVESSYDKFAKSNKDSYGLMQIRYKVWGSKLGVKRRKDLFRIKVNIGLGIGILKYYIDQNDGDVTRALQDYNGTYNKKFLNKVYASAKKFTDFRSAYENSNNKNICRAEIATNTRKARSNGKS